VCQLLHTALSPFLSLPLSFILTFLSSLLTPSLLRLGRLSFSPLRSSYFPPQGFFATSTFDLSGRLRPPQRQVAPEKERWREAVRGASSPSGSPCRSLVWCHDRGSQGKSGLGGGGGGRAATLFKRSPVLLGICFTPVHV